MANIKQTDDDFQRHLAEQIHFLQKSAKEYDEGDFLEAKQMSVRLRVLLHDHGRNSVSLLTHLNKKNIDFYDTSANYPSNNLLFESRLTCLKVHVDPNKPTEVTIMPPLGKGPSERYSKGKISFDKWWNNKIIDSKTGIILSRNDIIYHVCNKDGGAHIDAKLKGDYVNSINQYPVVPMSNGVEFGMNISQIKNDPNKGVVLGTIVTASIRQITYEVLESLKDEFPEFF